MLSVLTRQHPSVVEEISATMSRPVTGHWHSIVSNIASTPPDGKSC